MKKHLSIFSVVLAAAIGFSSCDKKDDENNCYSSNKSYVTAVDGPATGNVNQELTYNVSFPVINGCGTFQKLEQSATGDNNINVTVYEQYNGCICTQDIPVRQVEFKFKATTAGTYKLNFRQTDSTNLTKTVVIN